MVMTTRGVFHNLKESNYAVSFNDTALFFSSEMYRKKFLEVYESKRLKKIKILEQQIGIDCNFLSGYIDLLTYSEIEKRGFYVVIKGVGCECLNMEDVFKEKVTGNNNQQITVEWQKIKFHILQKMKEEIKVKM